MHGTRSVRVWVAALGACLAIGTAALGGSPLAFQRSYEPGLAQQKWFAGPSAMPSAFAGRPYRPNVVTATTAPGALEWGLVLKAVASPQWVWRHVLLGTFGFDATEPGAPNIVLRTIAQLNGSPGDLISAMLREGGETD